MIQPGDVLFVLRPLPDREGFDQEAPAAVRLRRALKTLKRAYRLRCVYLRGVESEELRVESPALSTLYPLLSTRK